MLDWNKLEQEYEELVKKLAEPNPDHKIRIPQQRRTTQLSGVLKIHKQIVALEKTITECEHQRDLEEGELKDLYNEEIAQSQEGLKDLQIQLEDILYPSDPLDDRSVFVEIRAGAGGQEAALFGSDLAKMYTNYALLKGWRASAVDDSTTDLGGVKELVLHIEGKGVYKFLKFESGVHRVQRVPKTEAAGRIHTSTVTVAVLPELDDVEININPSDLRVDTYRAGGAGGQHVNKTDSAVRITHIPSGIVVACQDERSQIKNRQKAMKQLQSKLFAHEKEKRDTEVSASRKQQVGAGERSEKIRTYNFPQNRITDHRTEVTLKRLDMILQGDLDDIINPLIEWDRVQRKATSTLDTGS